MPACLPALAGGAEIYVSPSGSDLATGSPEAPLANISEGLRRLRQLRQQGLDGPFILRLQEGIFTLDHTLVLSREDSGTQLLASPQATPIISGAWPSPGSWTPSSLVAAAWMTGIPPDWPEPRSVFHLGRALQRARGPGFSPVGEPARSSHYHLRRAVGGPYTYLPPPQASLMSRSLGSELRMIPQFPWSLQLLPWSEIDAESGLFKSAIPPTYPLKAPAFGRFPQGTAWIENAPEVLDEPGEWLYRREDRTLHLIPPNGSSFPKRPGDITIARLTELIRVEGRIDETALEDDPVRSIRLSGLTFTGANRYAWEQDKTGRGLQHDWERHDRPTAMVRLKAAETCVLEHCRFTDAGAAGLRLDLHARNNQVVGNEFARLGGCGILLAGYGLGFKDVNRDNLLAANHLHHLGTEWWHSPGIMAWQSGHNRILNNHLHHLPYCGIVVSGRTQIDVSGNGESSRTIRWDDMLLRLEETGRTWQDREPLLHARQNEISRNDIHHVMERLADGNAIYLSGAGGGNLVSANFIHDIPATGMNAALRSDDDQNDVIFDRNLIARVCGEGFIFKGRTTITGNTVFALLSKTPEGSRSLFQRGFWVLTGDSVAGSVISGNALVAVEPRTPILFEHTMPWKKAGRLMPPVRYADAESANNLYWNTALKNWAQDHLQTLQASGKETGSLEANPQFVDPGANDFRFAAGSPALSLGVPVFDPSTVGPAAYRP